MWLSSSSSLFVLPLFQAKRKRCENGGGVKPDDVISSPGTRQTASSKRHFSVLSLVLQFSCSPLHLSDELTTFNLRHSAVGHGQPLLPLQVLLCLLAPPCFAFEYNTWLSSGARIAQPRRTVIMLIRGYCCVRFVRRVESRNSFFLSMYFDVLFTLAHSRDYEQNCNRCVFVFDFANHLNARLEQVLRWKLNIKETFLNDWKTFHYAHVCTVVTMLLI